ncbi:MAG: glycosyltransferase family 2 protein [Clostridia bacterium]|nr:glycosyltransferase family 2 protein [Clostridia bacterium]
MILNILNAILCVIFTLCYLYQFIYLFVAYVFGVKKFDDAPPKKIAVLISARNESGVIANLLRSLAEQDYSKEHYRVFVVADNCTDNTAEIARREGAHVYERFNDVEKGKGYALDYLIKAIKADFGEDAYDAFIVFDADNVAEKNYITEMNKVYSAGYEVVTSYRNASNYGAGWRAAGQGMYFLRDARILNLARMRLNCNTFVTGTGFLFSNEVAKANGGWPFHCLTEDGEFTMDNCVKKVKTGYCHDAVFYDEQAVDRKNSWYQKLRWCKGGLQIFSKYLGSLIKGIFSRRLLTNFDMAMCLTAAYALSLIAVVVNVVGFAVYMIIDITQFWNVAIPMLVVVAGAYLALFVFSAFATVSEWKRIRASAFKKILYAFTFPLFIFSFIPAAAVALFKKVEWKPVRHSGEVTSGDAPNTAQTTETSETTEAPVEEKTEKNA